MILISSVTRSLFTLISFFSFASADLICGTLGYHNETNLSYFMGNFFYNGLTSFTLCAAYCQQDERCEAFRYSYWSDADAQYCEFFDTSLDGNFTADPTSLYYYYDIGCSFPAFGTPETVTSSRLVTVTSLVAVTSTLPAVTRTLTVAGAAATITRTATATSTTTQTLAAQIRTATSTLLVTTTILYPVTSTTTATAFYTVSATITATARPPNPPAVTVTRSVFRTTTTRDVRYLRTVTQTRTVTTTRRF